MQKQQQTTKNTPSPTSIFTTIQPSLSNTFSDVVGKWTISKIFGITNYAIGFDFVISNNTILIAGQCNTYILTFSLVSTNPIKIKK